MARPSAASLAQPAGVPAFRADAVLERATLDAALRTACEARGVKLAFWRRETRFQIVVTFETGQDHYWSVTAGIPPSAGRSYEARNEALAAAFIAELKKWQRKHGASRAA